MGVNAIDYVRGDSEALPMTFNVDITGYTIYFMVKERVSDLDTNALITVIQTTHTDAENGLTSIPITSDQSNLAPGKYSYSIRFTDNADVNKTIIANEDFNIIESTERSI